MLIVSDSEWDWDVLDCIVTDMEREIREERIVAESILHIPNAVNRAIAANLEWTRMRYFHSEEVRWALRYGF